jgi:hypothetical protein
MLANSYSHPHNYPSVAAASSSAYLDNMTGWREQSAASRPSYHHQAASSSSIHDVGGNGMTPNGLTISHSSPSLQFSTWDDPPQASQHHLTSSNSSPSLVFDHSLSSGHADTSNGNSYAYNNGSASTTSSTGYRSGTGYPAYTTSKLTTNGQHPSLSSPNSASFSTLPSSSQAAAAMYHQQQHNAIPSYHNYNPSSGPTSAVAPTPSGLVSGGLPEPKVLSSHDRPHPDESYGSSAPIINSHHFNHHQLSVSPTVNEYNSEYRSSHAAHPFEVKHRRRTTRAQFKVLEASFRDNPKPNAAVRKSVSQQLDMPIRAVQIWFQNRRAKAKAVAKREAGQSGDIDQDDEDYIKDEDEDGLRYSASPTHSLRPSASAGTLDSTSIGGYTTPHSASSETFKIPNRPLRIDVEGPNRRMTTGTMPSSNGFPGNSFYHSPPLSSSGSMSFPSHLSNPSPSFDTSNSSYTRPTSSSFSSSSYDDRYRRGVATSPGVLQHEGVHMTMSSMNPHRQSHQPFHTHHSHQQQQQQPQHYHHQQQQQQHHTQHQQQQMDYSLPSAFDPETRRLSLPENIPAEGQMPGNLSIMQPQQQYQQHHHRNTEDNTDYWRY